MMRAPSRTTLGWAGFAVAAGAAAFAAWGRSGGPPLAVCAAKVAELGQVPPAALVEHTFSLRNGGGSALKILSLNTTCGCTEARIDSPLIGPGDSTNVHATFRVPSRPGRATQGINVETNDPKNASLRLTVAAEVIVRVEIAPDTIDFGVVERRDLPVTRVARVLLAKDLVGNGVAPAALSSADDPNVETVLTPTVDPRVSELRVTIRESAPGGPLGSRVWARLRSDSAQAVSAPLLAQVRGGVFASPGDLVLTATAGGAAPVQSVRVRSRGAPVSVRAWRITGELRDALDVAAHAVGDEIEVGVSVRPQWMSAAQPRSVSYRGAVRLELAPRETPAGEAARAPGARAEPLEVPVLVFLSPDAKGDVRVVTLGSGCGIDGKPCGDEKRQ